MFRMRNYTDNTTVEQQNISAFYADDFKDRGTLACIRGTDPNESVLIELHSDHISIYRETGSGRESSSDIYGQDTVRLVFESYQYKQGEYTEAETDYLDFKLIDGVWKKAEAEEGKECSN